MQLKKYYKALSSKGETSVSEDGSSTIITNPLEVIKLAIENSRPLMSIEKVQVGSVEYQVPAPITSKRSEFEGMYVK